MASKLLQYLRRAAMVRYECVFSFSLSGGGFIFAEKYVRLSVRPVPEDEFVVIFPIRSPDGSISDCSELRGVVQSVQLEEGISPLVWITPLDRDETPVVISEEDFNRKWKQQLESKGWIVRNG